MQTCFEKKMPIFEELIRSLNEAGQLRNMVIHADWESAHNDGYAFCKLKMCEGGMYQEYTQFTVRSLKQILKQIRNTRFLFDKYIVQLEDLYRTR
jgi:hypothetical protein